MSEVITLGRRLNDLNIKIQDKILSDEKLIKLLASKTNDLSDIKEVDCPNDYVDKNIFFTIKNFEEAVSDSKNLMMMSFKINSSTPQYANITIEFIILVHKDLQELKNGDGRLWMIIDELCSLFENQEMGTVGRLSLSTATTVTPPNDYVAFRITFKCSDFKRNVGQ